MDKDKLIDINELLNLLALHGGEIVCSASLDTNDINQARASGRMAVTENNIGYVWMPNIMRMPQTDEEVQFFEKWFPLDVEMPDKFNDPDYIQKNIIGKVRSLTAPVPDGKEYPALWLIREGDYIYVRMEINKEWITLIREHYDGPFSHIIESLGIKEKLPKTPDAG